MRFDILDKFLFAYYNINYGFQPSNLNKGGPIS